MTFLPEDYSRPSTNSNYMKLEQGDNKFRILSDAIVGFVDWDKSGDKPVPVRSREANAPLGEGRVRHFWAFVVYDYKDGKIKILEITQSSIQEVIMSLHQNEAWGDPKGFDISITRTGEKLETKYSVVPTPPQPLAEEIETLYSSMKVDLNKLYNNGDPFEGNEETNKITPAESMQKGIDKVKTEEEANEMFNNL